MATDAIVVDNLSVIRTGACAAWDLPANNECPGRARRLVTDIGREIGLSKATVDDAVTMVSELATNATLHGGSGLRRRNGIPVAGLPELWIHLSSPNDLVVTIFDSGMGWADAGVPEVGEVDTHAEAGRGLQVVAALANEAGGRWGHHPSRARLGEDRVPGTAVWFTLPLPQNVRARPEPAGAGPARVPATAISRLAELLRSRGLDHLYHPGDPRQAVLSIHKGLTVWCKDGIFWWTRPTDNAREQHPITSEVEVAERIIAAYETLSRAKPLRCRPGDGERTTNPDRADGASGRHRDSHG